MLLHPANAKISTGKPILIVEDELTNTNQRSELAEKVYNETLEMLREMQ